MNAYDAGSETVVRRIYGLLCMRLAPEDADAEGYNIARKTE